MTAAQSDPAAQRRGKRPSNRRDLIVSAAASLFYERGYDQVSMSDIARAVAIVPSALYRHFPSKQQLLHDVISSDLAPIGSALQALDVTSPDTALRSLARQALERRGVATLWQRDARRLDEDHRSALRDQVRGYGRLIVRYTTILRPDLTGDSADLLAWSTASVLGSISFHHLELAADDYVATLGGLAWRVLSTPVCDPVRLVPRSASTTPLLVPRSRREALLARAIRMFADHGYTGVGLEDIGAAVGIAGPSVYNHFESKLDLLLTALGRATAYLQMDLSRTFASASDPRDALTQLIAAYSRFTQAHAELVDLLITETLHLPQTEQRRIRQTQHEYVAEWVPLVQAVDPNLDETHARVRVQAAMSVMNDIARTPHLRGAVGMPTALAAVCASLLGLASDRPQR